MERKQLTLLEIVSLFLCLKSHHSLATVAISFRFLDIAEVVRNGTL